MKEGWEYRKLGDVCDIIGGGTPSKKNALYYNGTIPWASVRDMNCDILSSTEYSITEEGLNDSASHIIEKGEIIIATRVGLGKVCVLAQSTAINQDLKGIIPKKENINRNFLFYYFKSRAKVIEENGVGATVKGVRLKFVETLQIPIPPLSEQHRIVEYLDTQFAKIDALKTNAEQQLQAAKDLFQSALKDLMTPKAGWVEKKLGEMCGKIQNIKWTEMSGTHKYVDLSSVSREDLTIMNSIEIDYQNAPSRAKQIMKLNDVLFATTRPTLRRLCLVPEDYDNDICSTGFCVLRPISIIHHKFLFYSLQTNDFYNYLEPLQTGANYPAVTDGVVKSYIFSFPTSLEEQQQIAAQLDDLSVNIKSLQSNYEQTLTLCNDLKQSLLKKIFE